MLSLHTGVLCLVYNIEVWQNFVKFYGLYFKNHCTNTRLVCTHLNALFMLNLNMAMKFEYWKLLKKRGKIQLVICTWHHSHVEGYCFPCWSFNAEILKFDKMLLKSMGCLKNHWTNTRLVCTHLNAFFHAESKYGYENLNFEIFWKSLKIVTHHYSWC